MIFISDLRVVGAFARWHALCSKLDVPPVFFRSSSCFGLLQASLLALCLLTLAPMSWAQSISIEETTFRIERADQRLDAEDPDAISRKDCLDDDPELRDYDRNDAKDGRTWIRFPLRLNNITQNNSSLEIWVSQGADCLNSTERVNNNCTRIYQKSDINQAGPTFTAVVYPREVVAAVAKLSTDESYPGAEVCDSNLEVALTFFVMVMRGDTSEANDKWTETDIDLVGPDPPSEIGVEAGEEHLFVDWSIPTEEEQDDVQGFRIYCAPGEAPMATNQDAEGMGGTTAETCGTSLAPGQLPALDDDDIFECGDASGVSAREGKASKVENGIVYAVAVSARDQVGNAGPLSEVRCIAPQEVTTFFEAYKEAGGKGGGGYCGYTPRRSSPSAGWLGLLLFTSLLACSRARSSASATRLNRKSQDLPGEVVS